MKKLLTIAGSDCSGGAGIQADLKTFSAHRTYGMSVITALTAQNTTGVQEILEIPPDFVAAQLNSVCTDIMPDAVKIGMVSNADTLRIIVKTLQTYQISNIVVDPVMVSTSGSKLLKDDAIAVMKTELLPIATVITPNIPEAEALSGLQIVSDNAMLEAALRLYDLTQTAILIKGGHKPNTADDLLYDHAAPHWYRQERIHNDNTHGTGCTLSSAIAVNLALGYSLPQSVENSKAYITAALKSDFHIGQGRGPLNHFIDFSTTSGTT